MSKTSESEPRLAVKMPASIPVAGRDALGHPYRRQILRALQREAVKLSPAELTESGLLPCTPACAAYHLQVLTGSGLAESVETEAVGSGITQRFAARIDEDGPVLSVLRETEQSDQRRLAATAS